MSIVYEHFYRLIFHRAKLMLDKRVGKMHRAYIAFSTAKHVARIKFENAKFCNTAKNKTIYHTLTQNRRFVITIHCTLYNPNFLASIRFTSSSTTNSEMSQTLYDMYPSFNNNQFASTLINPKSNKFVLHGNAIRGITQFPFVKCSSRFFEKFYSACKLVSTIWNILVVN